MRRIYILLLTAASLVLLAGCFKKVTTSTTFVVKTLLQTESAGENVPLEGCRIYAFKVDSDKWEVASYADAVAGRAINNETGEEQTEPYVEGEPYSYGEATNYICVKLTASPSLVVVVDEQTGMYATMFRRLEAQNLRETFVTLILHSWKNVAYKEGNKVGYTWMVYPPVPAEEETPNTEN